MINLSAHSLETAKQALEALDADKILSAYAQDFLFEDVPAQLQIRGRQELREYFQGLFASPGTSFSEIRIFDGGSFAAIEWTWGGLTSKTGESFLIRGASVIELLHGKIARESIYYDAHVS
jgi:ketosteroid isomerase-like protein